VIGGEIFSLSLRPLRAQLEKGFIKRHLCILRIKIPIKAILSTDDTDVGSLSQVLKTKTKTVSRKARKVRKERLFWVKTKA
jgi:hypothetical protein